MLSRPTSGPPRDRMISHEFDDQPVPRLYDVRTYPPPSYGSQPPWRGASDSPSEPSLLAAVVQQHDLEAPLSYNKQKRALRSGRQSVMDEASGRREGGLGGADAAESGDSSASSAASSGRQHDNDDGTKLVEQRRRHPEDVLEKKKKKKKIHKLSFETTEDFNEKLKRRGVVYVARVPPKMTPTKVKSLLGDFGEVTRVYLVEEDAAARKRRRKLTGNASKRYVEGWVEFASKKVAKHVAASLNNTPITNHKRSPHYGDLWSLKYLHRFKWSHLTEKVAYERRVREQKLRLETMQARRETQAYKELVETGKKLDKIEQRKRRRAEKEGKTTVDDGNEDRPIKMKKARFQYGKSDDADDRPTSKVLLSALF